MDYLLASMVIFIMAVAGRAHGSATKDEVTGVPTGWPSWDKTAAMIVFGVAFAWANYSLFDLWWLALLSGAASVLALNTGHGRFFAMDGANLNDPNPEKIEKYLVLWWYPGDITKPLYSWVCMGIKGLLVGLAAFPYGLSLAVLWPLSYYLSTRFSLGQDKTCAAEWLRGVFSGMVVIASVFLS